MQPQWHGGLSSEAGVAVPPRPSEVSELDCPTGSTVSGNVGLPLDDHWRSQTRDAPHGAAAVLLDYSQGGTYHVPPSLFVAPSLIVGDAEIDRIFDALDAGLEVADREVDRIAPVSAAGEDG